MKLCLNCESPINGRRKHAIYCTDKCGNRARGARWEKVHPDRVIANQKRMRDVFPVRQLLYRCKYRAKKLGLPFNLTEADITIPKRCPVLGIRIEIANGACRGYRPNAPSIDRFKPRKGYVRGNVCMMSARANLLKNDATLQELQKVVRYLQQGGGK